MLNVPMSLRVFAKTTPTDMRKSFDGLAGLVEQELGQQVELATFSCSSTDAVIALRCYGSSATV